MKYTDHGVPQCESCGRTFGNERAAKKHEQDEHGKEFDRRY